MENTKFRITQKTIALISVLALIVVAAIFVVLKRDSIIPGWHTEGSEKYYITFPFKRASGIKSIDGKDYFFK